MELRHRIALYVILGLVGLWLVHRITRPSVEDAVWEQQTAAVLKIGKAYRQRQEQDRLTIKRLQEQAKKKIKTADSVRVIRETIKVPEITPAACEPFAEALSLCEQETKALREAYEKADSATSTAVTRAERAEQRADTLETLLRKRPRACRLLGIPCPKISILGPHISDDGDFHYFGLGVTIPL